METLGDRHTAAQPWCNLKSLAAGVAVPDPRAEVVGADAERCEGCDGTGWRLVEIGRGNRRGAVPCNCRLERRQKFAPGVPLEFRDAMLATWTETPPNRHAVKAVSKWLEADGGRDLFVFGGVGSGKTRLACTALNEAHQRRRAALFTRVPMLLVRLQPSDVEHAEQFVRCCDAPLLVLDDLGAERETATDFTRRTLLMLYEERGDRGHRTIWTSNQDLLALAEFMHDERLTSRIKGRADLISLDGADWRMARRRYDTRQTKEL